MSDEERYAKFEVTAARALPIAVVGGAGYVGSITAVGLAHLGHRVVGVDVNRERLAQLTEGTAPFHEPGLAPLPGANITAGRIRFPDALPEALAEAKVVFVAVNTPRRDNGEADLSHIIDVATGLGRCRA